MKVLIKDKSKLHLPQFAWSVGKKLGTDRQIIAVRNHATNQMAGIGNQLEHNIGGARAELAFACAANVWPDLSTSAMQDPDVVLWNGARLDVKWASERGETFRVTKEGKNKAIDSYVSLYGGHLDDPDREKSCACVFGGWILKEAVFQDRWLTRDRYGEAYVIPRTQLDSGLVIRSPSMAA